jgi:hypothetical protein
MYQLENITVPRRSKSGFFVFSHARVRPLRNKRRNPASMKLAGSFVRPDLSLEGRGTWRESVACDDRRRRTPGKVIIDAGAGDYAIRAVAVLGDQ